MKKAMVEAFKDIIEVSVISYVLLLIGIIWQIIPIRLEIFVVAGIFLVVVYNTDVMIRMKSLVSISLAVIVICVAGTGMVWIISKGMLF